MYGQPVNNYTPALPVAAPVDVGADEELETFRDYRDLDTGNITNNVLSLFTSNPSRSQVDRNYSDNPLPRNIPYRILAIGFAWKNPIEESTANIDPESYLNDILYSEVRLLRNQGRTEVLQYAMPRLVEEDKCYVTYGAFDDGTDSGRTTAAVWATRPLTRLPDEHEMTVGPDERFDLEVEFDSVSAIPASANTDNKLGAFIQTAHPPTD